MNASETNNLLSILCASIGSYFTAHGLATQDQVATAATNLSVIVPALISLFGIVNGIYSHWNMKKVPESAVPIDPSHLRDQGAAIIPGVAVNLKDGNGNIWARVAAVFVAGFLLGNVIAPDPAFAADNLPVKASLATLPASNCTAGNCSGGYLTFGADMNAALASTLTGTSNQGNGIDFGGGYQYWQGQVLAGMEITGGYRFGTGGNTGSITSTQFVKLGYNFFPSQNVAAPSSSQNPFVGLVPANLLANSTPALLMGGCYGHGIEKGCVGAEVDTVIAAQWSTAFQWYNAPSYRGQADENVFRIMVQRHLN